ncbi:MAG: fibronectin type III domain-containing protein, partial [Patescibacteria group bacterium]|nr:fibronectin type III domain-containing protein [Patescibacteria group bacterium]
MAVFGLFGFIGIDVLAGNDKTQIKGEYRLERLDEQADFGMSDDVVMNFKFSKDKKVFADFAQWFKFLFVDEYKNLNIQIKVLDAKGDRAKEIKPEVKYLGDGEFDIAVDESSIKKPGKYSVLISFNDSDLTAGETINFEQDFSWGVLAFNTNKSIFLPTETAYLQMAVLDEMGHTLCGADLYLEITAPDGGTAFLNTDNGLIIRNPRCGPDNIIHSPDYFAYYGLAGAGEYLVKLTARSANGEYSIIDKFEVRESLPFEIERVGPTRINPVADYNMVLRIKANEDFVGNIIERIPSDFKITNYKLQITNNIQYPISNIQNNSNGTITLNDFKLEAGQEVEFSYSFDAPDISPEFYLFGEARLEETKFLQSDPDRRNLVSFSEARQWQIASDATTSITFKFATSGSSVNWDNLSGTDPSYAWDKTQGTYAGRDIPKKTGGGEPDNYLQAEANDSYDLGNTIEKVEIGFESYCEDTGYVDVYLLPVFDGQAGSTKMFGGTDLGTTDNNTIHWYDVTGVGYAPTTWYWSHVMSLDARVYGVNSHNGQSRWIRVDQFYVRVTYQLNNAPSGSIDSAQFRSDGSGVVDLSINVSDPENDDSRARIDYVLGADCNFNDATSTLDETDATATSTSGTDPKIENDNYYQIGNASGWIDTSAANTVYFDWLSQSDIPNASSTYCVRLRVNDQLVDQTTEATTTIYIDNYPPQISDVNFEPSSGWLKIGDTATATIYADNTDYASGTITINGVDAADTLVDNGDNTYSLTYTVAEGDDYIGLEDNLPVSIALKDSYNNSSAAYTTADAAGRPGVDGDIPVISSASVVNDAYKIGDTIDVSVSADEAGYTLGTTTVNSVLMEAGNFTDNGGGSYTISYTVSESDTDQGSGNIPVSIILIDAAGNVSGALESLDINVASIDAHAPAISGLSISNTAMKVGDNVTVTFTVGDDNGDEYSLATGTINGFPLAGFTRFDSTTYTAEFTVVEGGNDAAAGSDITVSNIVIEDTAGNQSGAYNTPISQDSDPIDANTPEFDAVIFSPDAEVLKIGDTATITITILAAETSLASGSTMTVNGIDVRDTFVDINGSSAQVTYTVEEGHDDKDDTDNLPVVFYIKDGAGNESLIYNDVDVNGRPGVDGHAPTILNITIPNIAMKVGGTVIATTTVGDDGGESYSLATGTIGGFSLFNFNRVDNTTYTMEFTIAEGGNDVPAGSDIPVDNVIIQDVVANESSAYNTPISQAGDLLDANTPLISDVVFNITEGILKIGDTATATISSDGTGYSGGTIEINSIDVSGTLAAGAGNNYTVTYTVEEGHTDIPDSSDLPISLSLVDTAGNESAAYETQATTSRPGVDAHAPAISGLSIPNTAMKVGDNVTVTFTVGDDNGDEYSLATGTINGFPLAGFTRFDSTTYTAEFTVVEGGNDAAAGSDITVSNIVIEDTAGNQSGAYNTPISQAGDPIDANTPSQPGPLSLYQKYSASLVLNLGATTTEANFSEYKIFYKQGSSGVTESDSEWSQSNDGNFDNILFYGATTTTITGLATGTEYVFNIWVYDSAGNKASSTSEFSTYTNYDPGSAGGLFQYRSDAATPILNTGWINEDNVILQANVNDDDTDEVLTLYFEAATSTDSFSGDVSSPCDEASGWDSCAGKVWATSSSAGDYSSSPFTGQVHLSALPNSATGIKWRVMACDDSGAYSAWVDAGADPNFKVDHQAPAAPGNLAPIDRSAVSVTFELTGTTTESNFNEYRIYYKAGSSGVTEDDFLFASTSDPNLADINFLSATTTTVDSLSAGTEYVFNIWAYDLAGNSAHAVEVSTTTSLAAQPPTGIFDSATQKTDGSGAIDVSIIADDPDNDNTLRARLDYVLGVTCDFGDPLDPYIDTENVSDSHASAPDIDNTYEYQVGTSTGWIITAPGANTVSFDWLSKLNIPEADGDYCLQLRVNDGSYSQVSPATTSIYIDNAAPDPPGDLQYEAKDIDSITLSFGATSSDSNFSHYKIFYKAGSSGVAENDSEHVDGDLNSFNYGGTATTAISNLAPGTEYVINIWAYDDYGNKASATEMTATINYLPEVPVALTQKLSDGATDISNGIWITQDSVNLTARANDSDTSEVITMYFELLPANDTLKTATTAPFSACPAETDWDSCDSKVWHATSSEGDYSASPFIATVTPSALPDSETGYMWQVMVCDDNDACSEWTIFNLDQPNFKADSHAPSEPGPLSVVDFDAASVTLDLGATSTEDYFYQYIIYYSESSPVTEAGYEHSSSTDINLFAQDFDTATSTEIEGLDPGTLYNFNIWAYDKAGNAASSSFETATTTNNYPAADFVSASQKRDGSGAVDISIQVDDADDDDEIRAKIDYVLGEACDFASASDPTLKELDASATSTYGDAKVENDNTYQIGNSLGWILTSSGQNTVNFDWLSQGDIPYASSTYCLRLTINDGRDNQEASATTTLEIDNYAPSTPGNLEFYSHSSSTIILAYGDATTEDHFSEYRIFYLQGAATADENDTEHNDSNL